MTEGWRDRTARTVVAVLTAASAASAAAPLSAQIAAGRVIDASAATPVYGVHVSVVSARHGDMAEATTLNGFYLLEFDFPPIEDVEGIEIYPNASFVPPQLIGGLARNEGCGAVVVWTGRRRGNPFTLKRIAIAASFAAVGTILLR